MGTRCGDVDPNAILYIMKKENISPDDMYTLVNKKSGFLGVSQRTSDAREMDELANSGDFKAFSKSAKFMFDLLQRDLAHLLGTDCHNITSRAPDMDVARNAISKKISPHCFSHLMHNAEKVYNGENI